MLYYYNQRSKMMTTTTRTTQLYLTRAYKFYPACCLTPSRPSGLVSYCTGVSRSNVLRPNQFHLLLHQTDQIYNTIFFQSSLLLSPLQPIVGTMYLFASFVITTPTTDGVRFNNSTCLQLYSRLVVLLGCCSRRGSERKKNAN